MKDIFFDLYKNYNVQTVGSQAAREKLKSLIQEVESVMGKDKAEELMVATTIICEEEGICSYIGGFRFGIETILMRM